MRGRELKAAAILAGVPLYAFGAEARINPGDLSRLLSDRRPLSTEQVSRIGAAIERLALTETPRAGAH
jgi:hypothetical protein